MEQIVEAMKLSTLFAGVTSPALEEMVSDFHLRIHAYDREEFVLHQGERAKGIGLIVSGRLHIVREDFLGNREIIAEAERGDIFDEVFAILSEEPQSVSAVAAELSRVVFLPMEELMFSAGKCSQTQMTVIGNMFRVIAEKNLFLTRKMAHLSRRTIREKLISYFSEESGRQRSLHIEIPFNRQQLADYLAVERSALSRELSRMKEEGLIEYRKNSFVLHHTAEL